MALVVTGTLVSFHAGKGFGFVTPDGGGPDILLRRDVLIASGVLKVPPTNSSVQCVMEVTPRGPYASRVLFITAHPSKSVSAIRGPEVMTVKSYNPTRGYGFLVRQDGVNVLLLRSVLQEARVDALRRGEQLRVWYAPDDDGFKAKRVQLVK